MTDAVQTPHRGLTTAALAAEFRAQDPQLWAIVGGRAGGPTLKSAGDLGVERDPCLVLDALEGKSFDRDAGTTV